MLSAYNEIRDAYLSALVAPTIDEAKEGEARGQAALDRAAQVLDRFNQHSEWSERTEGDPSQEDDGLVAGAEAIAALSGSSDLVSLDTQGAELFDRITGGDITCPQGFGVALRLLDFAVETSMNKQRFWAVSQTVYRQLTPHDVALQALLDDKQWRRDLASVAQEALAPCAVSDQARCSTDRTHRPSVARDPDRSRKQTSICERTTARYRSPAG